MEVRRFRRLTHRLAAGLALLGSFLAAPAHAGTTGRIAGRVLDQKTHQPLEGVNIAVPLARLGAASSADGRYLIVNVPAGIYDVKVGMIGYRATTLTGVVVSADNTTALDVALEPAPVAMEEIVVSAQRPVVDLRSTANMAAIDRTQLKTLPVQELQDVVNLQAGVVDGHFRGGRLGEVQYQVDGVSVNNPFDNKSSMRIDRSLLEEVQVISGTFDAEYGQAMSGVVNAVLRRGSETFRWDGEAMLGAFVYQGGERRRTDFVFRPAGTQNYQFGLSGPVSWQFHVPKTFYLASVRYWHFDDYLTAEHRFTPWIRPEAAGYGVPSAFLKMVDPDGSGAKEPLGWSREWSGVGKLTNRAVRNVELSYQAVWNVMEAQRMNWALRLDPDGAPQQHTFSIAHGADITHTLNPRTYYDLSFRQNYFDYTDHVYENPYDSHYNQAGPLSPVPGVDYEYGAMVQGVDFSHYIQKTDSRVLKGDFVSQVGRDQQFKAGGELTWSQVSFGQDVTIKDSSGTVVRIVDAPPYYPAPLVYRPYQAAAFVQDELEWSDLRIRAGLRFDYFNPKSGQPSDLANPANALKNKPQSHYEAASRKTSVSPRLGVSYPVTRDASLFFAYGHFYQMPAIGDVFRNTDFRVLADLQASRALGTIPVMGNPDIRPERTVQYQFGYKQAVREWLGLDATVFYKDIRDLLGVELIETYNGAVYAHLTNVDFGNVIGFTLVLDQRRRGLLSTSIDYTFQSAMGNSSDPDETYTRAAAGEDPRPRQIPFNWDQRHTLNATVSLSKDRDYIATVIFRLSSGMPYTPATAIGSGLEANSGRKPAGMVVDLRAEKQLPVARKRASLFLRVLNLFDSTYLNGPVFDTTGDPYYSRFSTDKDALHDPTRLYTPRRIEVGISMGGGE
jgi:outer membrane receptor protein involved in Fe transport